MIVSRIAPTPSGFLHIGNAYNFLKTNALVKENKGKLILRIDDSDSARVRDEYLQDVFESLDYLEIEIDEGPSSPDDFKKNYSQQNHESDYQKKIETLKAKGLLFACTCSRKQLQALGGGAIYPGLCIDKNIDLNTKEAALRFKSKLHNVQSINCFKGSPIEASLAKHMGDFVVVKKDGKASYQLVSLSEDLRLGVNTIVRGNDLFSSTLAQLALAQALDEKAFTKVEFVHHKLILDENGQKLSKSEGSQSLKALRESGISLSELKKKCATTFSA